MVILKGQDWFVREYWAGPSRHTLVWKPKVLHWLLSLHRPALFDRRISWLLQWGRSSLEPHLPRKRRVLCTAWTAAMSMNSKFNSLSHEHPCSLFFAFELQKPYSFFSLLFQFMLRLVAEKNVGNGIGTKISGLLELALVIFWHMIYEMNYYFSSVAF